MDLVALFDVDNTLLDNDGVKDELDAGLRPALGEADRAQFWRLYEEVRSDLGMVSFPRVLERFLPAHCDDPLAPQRAAVVLFGCDFASHLRPGALELLEWARRHATPVILSNGDQFFQRWKIWRAGLADAAEGRVWVFPEKQHHFQDLDGRAAAGMQYLLVEDKVDALHAARSHWGDRVITVFVDFGHHAADSEAGALDMVVGSPAELLDRLEEIGLPPHRPG